ncbi:unnamed protein product [Lymnaea stagnalis]|uniref:Palmitoyltransferase n=1 Tax=Lymnaea stagnalis TaxID=6523 RepID=A0AAV2HK83_LYMST
MEDYDCSPSLLQTQPGEIEMERTEHSLLPPPPVLESLRSKLLAHYKKGVNKPSLKILSSPLTPETVNRIAVPLFLFTVFSCLKIGFWHVMPLMYEGNDNIILLQQAIVVFLFTELMIFWLGIRYVDSSYVRHIQKLGNPRVKKTFINHALLHQKNQQDNSTAVLMPLFKDNGSHMDGSQARTNDTRQLFVQQMTTSELDLNTEAEQANKEMNKINEQINSRSIDDLINVSDSRTNVSDSKSIADLISVSETNTKLSDYTGSLLESSSQDDKEFTSPKPVITTDGKTIIKSYPYWSWVPCYDCGRARPPRCHHCPICHTCVLKRDHHCFFAGSCVGYRNHRFFFVFLLYAFVGCIYATIHGFPYIFFYLWDEMSYADIFFPFAIVRFILGYLSFHAALSVTTLSLLLYFDVLTVVFIYANCHLISSGLTAFEKAFLNRSLEIKDTRNLRQKIQAVFGAYWALGFILPTFFVFEPAENPVDWPDIMVKKH